MPYQSRIRGIKGHGGRKPPKPTRKPKRYHKQPGPKPFEPTAEQRRQVALMAGFGLPQDQIALLVLNPDTGNPINEATLKLRFRHELDLGIAQANLAVAQSLHQMAVGRPVQYDEEGRLIRSELSPNPTSAIFWAKTRMRWRETSPFDGASTPDRAGQAARDKLATFLGLEPSEAGTGEVPETAH